MEAKHLSKLKGKFWEDREILHAVEFEKAGTFRAISAAQLYLQDLGYSIGSMARDEPIGFSNKYNNMAKWPNLTNSERGEIDGVILPDPGFREGGATILFFNPPAY
jgi:hypothetical protein